MLLRLRIYALFLIVPTLLVLMSVYMVNAQGPYHLGTNLDPSYAYLMNALNLVTFHFPYHIDHPGTTVQEFGGVVVVAKWITGAASSGHVSLERDVLTHPDDYLRAIMSALDVLVAGAVFAAGWTMFRISGSLVAALVLQMSVFAFRATMVALAQVGPDPALVAAGFALTVPLIPVLLAKPGQRQWEAPAAGIIFAFGVIAKIIFLPMAAVGMLFTVPKQKRRFVLAALAAMMFFVLPALHRASVMANWFYGLMIHTGFYGQGDVGVPSFAQMLENLYRLLDAEPFLFLFLGYYVLVLWVLYAAHPTRGARPKGKPASIDPLLSSGKRLLWIGLAVLTVQLLLTLKHYAPRYMLPALALTALLNSFVVLLLSSHVLSLRPRRWLSLIGAILLLAAVLDTAPSLHGWVRTVQRFRKEASRLAETRSNVGNCVTIGYYGSSVSNYALAFGSEYSAGVHGRLLEDLYSDVITYNMFGRGFHSFSMEPRNSQVRHWLTEGRCVLAQGIPLSEGQYELPAEFALQPIAAYEREALFRLVLKPNTRNPVQPGPPSTPGPDVGK